MDNGVYKGADAAHTQSMAPDHWKQFAEFARWERAVGGPDPHMGTAAHLVLTDPVHDRLWMAGCYVAVYNVPGALKLYERWGARISANDEPALVAWLRENWAGIPFRRERRAVRTPEKLARFLISYANWMRERPWRWWRGGDKVEQYEQAWWDSGAALYGYGRYAALKLLEFMRRYCDAPIELVGIRARGGWSPREGLMMLWPDVPMIGVNSPTGDRTAEDYAAFTMLRLAEDYGEELDWYMLQVLLCDYKQSWYGRQYPGRSLDSEIEHARKVMDHFGGDLRPFWEARQDLFPAVARGETRGWSRVRGELGHVLRDHGYTWSDLRFDYRATADLAQPVAQ